MVTRTGIENLGALFEVFCNVKKSPILRRFKAIYAKTQKADFYCFLLCFCGNSGQIADKNYPTYPCKIYTLEDNIMSRFRSQRTIYVPQKKKNISEWSLDTTTATVSHIDSVTLQRESKTYSTDYVKYHLSFSASHCPDRLCRLVNDGTIIQYLDALEQRVGDAIDRQVEMWKQHDKEYQVAVLSGDIQKAAGLENSLVYMAREAIFECMVYI